MNWWKKLLDWLVPDITPVPKPPIDPVTPLPLGWIPALLEEHNNARRLRGRGELVLNAELSKAAIEWCSWMAAHKTMTHGADFTARIKEEGYNYSTAGENIAKGQQTPDQVMDAWKGSPGHFLNIINPNYKDIGIGFKKDSNGIWYWCVDFGAKGTGLARGVENINLPGGIEVINES